MSLYSSLTQVLAPFAAKINGLLTGWDGTRYSTPGEAVRQQIADLHVLIGDEPGTAISASAISYGESDVETALDGVNGRLHEYPYENLFSLDSCTPGYLDSNGNIQSNSHLLVSDYIPFDIDNPLIISGRVATSASNVYCGFYDSEKTKVDTRPATLYGNGVMRWIPENTAYVRLTLDTADVDFKVCKKSLAAYNDTFSDVETSRLKGIENPVYLEDNLGTSYWDYASVARNEATGWRSTELIDVKAGDIVHILNSYARSLSLYSSDLESVIAYANDATGYVRKHFYYIVPSDGKIGFNTSAANADGFTVYINGRRIITSADLSWLNVNVPQGAWSTWTGKSAIMFGDSLVSGQADDSAQGGAYARRLVDILGLTGCSNHGASGKPIAEGTSASVGTVTSVTNTTNYTSYDLVIIAGGTNDFKLNVPIGDIAAYGSTFDRTTFCGALQTIIEWIMSKKPQIRLVFWTPLQRNNGGCNTYTVNTVGKTLPDYCQAIKDVAARYGIPVIDMFNISGVNLRNLSYYTADGLHLNGNGYDIVTYIAAKQLNVL